MTRHAGMFAAIGLALIAGGCLAREPEVVRPSGPPVSAASATPALAPPAPLLDPSAPPASIVATPAPTVPGALGRQVTIERDGLRVTLELDRNPMPAGEVTWVTKTVENVGADPIQYFPCGEAMSVTGLLQDRPWLPGAQLPNPQADWKKYLLQQVDVRDGKRQVFFLPKGLTGSSSGCGDIGYVEILAPGKALSERSRWDGLTFRRLAPPPTTRVDLVGSFEYAHAAKPDIEAPRLEIGIHLETWIDGRREAYLDPAEVADIALSEPRLRALLAARDLNNGNESVLRFDPVSATYQVGILDSGGLPVAQAHLLSIDAVTGEVVGWVERDWDYAIDDYP
jgi:hypothetical protein